MIDLGLHHADRRAFVAALQDTHEARTTVEVLDRDEQVLHELTDRVVGGSVDVDATEAIDRTLNLELADDDKAFHFVPQGPGDFAIYADNFLRVKRGIWVDAIHRWVDTPVFTGPIETVEPGGNTVTVTALGKESLGLEPSLAWRPDHIPKGHPVVDAIHDILYDGGERKFDLPKSTLKLKKPVSLGRTSERWKVANKLAVSVDRQLFFDGRGKVRLRAYPHSPAFTFRTGTDGNVTSRPVFTYDVSRVRNVVEVLGPEPEGKAKRIRFVAMPNPAHPLSPQKLARHDEPRYLVERVEADHIHRTEQARSQAERKLKDLLRGEVDVAFDAVPIYTLEPGDEIALSIEGSVLHFKLQRFSLPLIGGSMSVGYTRRTGVRKKKGHR